MASNWLYIDTNFPTFTGEEDLNEKVTTIQNYLFMLVEQMRYTLHNLDGANMNAAAVNSFTETLTEPIYAAIEDAEGNITRLSVTAGEISSRVSDAEGNISGLQQTATSLAAAVQDNKGNITTLQLAAQGLSTTVSNQAGQITTLQQTASGLSVSVRDAEGNISALQQTVSGLSATVSNQAGQISTLQQTASGLSTTVSNQAGQISSLQQTASSLSSRITNNAGQISSLWQTVDGFSLSVRNGSDYSTVSLTSGGVAVASARISMTGMVTFSDLSTAGYTTINGGNITTGTIKANNVGVSNRFSLYTGNTLYGYMGCGYGSDGNGYTYGAQLCSASGSNYFIATNAGARMTADGTSLYCVSGGVHASKEISVDSDRRVKSGIQYGLERYERFFQALRPCAYYRNGEQEKRFHTGFIAQDVERALEQSGLSYADFAALVRNPRLNPEYSLRYGEFTALNTYMIQRLMKRVEALERKTA